jgi:mRNA-degrading endonuclease RelE of RelBE toxin-antitoxin system
MNHEIRFSDAFKKSLEKHKKRDPVLFEQVKKKLKQLGEDPDHFKPLSYELHGLRRVHFGSFVLTYRQERTVVWIIALDHHDQAY